MTNNPDEIRREIEDTRGRLSSDVNALTETVSPSNVARRQADKVAGRRDVGQGPRDGHR